MELVIVRCVVGQHLVPCTPLRGPVCTSRTGAPCAICTLGASLTPLYSIVCFIAQRGGGQLRRTTFVWRGAARTKVQFVPTGRAVPIHWDPCAPSAGHGTTQSLRALSPLQGACVFKGSGGRHHSVVVAQSAHTRSCDPTIAPPLRRPNHSSCVWNMPICLLQWSLQTSRLVLPQTRWS